MNTICTTTALLAFALCGTALAQQADHRLDDHPAVVVKRLYAQQGYDYAAKVYPHPAWLFLHAEAPRPLTDHPAVIVFKRQRQEAVVHAATPEPSLTAAANH